MKSPPVRAIEASKRSGKRHKKVTTVPYRTLNSSCNLLPLTPSIARCSFCCQFVGANFVLFRLWPRQNPLRRGCSRVVSHPYFERVIIGCIIANSIVLGLVDFSVVDAHLNPVTHGTKFKDGALVDAYSLSNHVVEMSEHIFTVLFTLECVLKVIALGVTGNGSYLGDPWNVIDFLLLFASYVAEIPGLPNISELRAVRVLRPLRSLSASPGMRRLVSALLSAIPAIHSVVALLLFVLVVFGILGIQLFGGRLSRVCRLTEYPVKMPPDEPFTWPVPNEFLRQVIANPSTFRCLDAPLLDYTDSTPGYSKETSPWRVPQNCFWPVHYSDGLLCADPYHPGGHKCPSGYSCGSNYDAFGNPRFSSDRVMQDALHTSRLNWGYTTYDNLGRALLTIFQSVTKDGWTTVMYMTMDASHPVVGACFAVALIIFASYFVMNLTIAVISEEFKADKSGRWPSSSSTTLSTRMLDTDVESPLQLQPLLFRISTNKYFANFITLVIFTNTVVLSLDHYPMSYSMSANLELTHFAFLCIFILEMLVKVIGLGARRYFRDKFNLFDTATIVADLLEVTIRQPSFLAPSHKGTSSTGSISLLRSFRLFRVFELARDWKSLRDLLEAIARAVSSIGNFGVLLFLFIYIFALMGMQLFGNTMRFDDLGYPTPHSVHEFWNGTAPRSNFDTLPWAFATVFQIVTGDSWSMVMHDAMRGNDTAACLYFIVLQVVLGDFILMNLFLALLLDNFEVATDATSRDYSQGNANKLSKQPSLKIVKVSPAGSKRRFSMDDKMARSIVSTKTRRRSACEGHLKPVLDESLDLPSLTPSSKVMPSVDARNAQADDEANDCNLKTKLSLQLVRKGSGLEADQVSSKTPRNSARGNSLYLFGPTNPLRLWAIKLSTHPTFDSAMFVLIVVSSIVLALENPLHDPQSLLSTLLLRLDKAFAVAFLFEMAIKTISVGFVMHKAAYLRNPWNVVDGFIALLSIVLLFPHVSATSTLLKSLLSLRDLRAIRPLRMISRRPGLKLVVSALVEAIPAVLNVVFLSMVMFLLFSIAAVHFLKGSLRACSGEVFDMLSPEQKSFLVSPTGWETLSSTQQSWFMNTTCEGFSTNTITSQYVCECWGASWTPVLAKNFDNVGSAMLTFFILSTSENWSEIMKAACDATGPGMQPIVNHNEIWIVFFIVFMVVGSFFVMNVFVGVIIDNFNTMKAKLGGDFLLTSEQKRWIEAQESARRIGPIRIVKAPRQRFRRLCFKLVRTQYFEGFVMSCILADTLLMAAQYFGESSQQQVAFVVVSDASTGVFVLEAAIKLVAYGRAYFDDRWNQFDFFVVVSTLVGAIVQVFASSSLWTLTMLVKLVRVARIVRLVEGSSSIRAILSTLFISLPGLSNITSILFLILFVYATMGVHLFAKVGLTTNIDAHANFQTFGRGFLFLLRAATGESWDHCMYDFASSAEGCVADPLYDPMMCGFSDAEDCVPLNGCGSPVAYLFFCSFTLIVSYVMLNLTVAVVLESFATSQEEEEESVLVPELLEVFQYKWAEMDPMATGFIRVEKMLPLVHSILPPLGWCGIPLQMPQFFRYMRSLHLPLYEGDVVHFRDVVLAMTRETMNEMNNWALDDSPIQVSNKRGRKAGGASKRKLTGFYAHEYFAARYLHRKVVRWLVNKQQLERKSTRDFIRKMKKTTKKARKINRQKSGTLVFTVMKEGPNIPTDAQPVPSQTCEYVEKFIREEHNDNQNATN